MKEKIIKNKEVLHGKTFNSNLMGKYYEFKIMYVNEDVVKISISFDYSEINRAGSDSFEGIIKKIILETSPDNSIPLARQATMSRNRLKKIPIIVDNNDFKFEYITNSQVMVVKFIEYDELINSNDGSFLGSVRRFIGRNLLDNPPESKPIKDYGYGDVPYLFDSGGDPFIFRELGPRRTVVSERKLEENREKYRDLREEERKKRERAEKLDKELNLDKKPTFRNLPRHR